MTTFEELWRAFGVLLAQFGLNILAALAILGIGIWAARGVRRLLRNLLSKRLLGHQAIDPTLISFTTALVYYGILAFTLLATLNRLGVQTASLIALLGAAGLAIGLALQGSLESFAAGILMLVFRPFRVGDYIEGAGMEGTVESISLFTTSLVTLDNRVVIIPNSKLNSGNIINHSAKGYRRVDVAVGVSYSTDLDLVRRVVLDELRGDRRILADPEPKVVVVELGDSSVNLSVRPWVESANYWGVYFDTYERVKKRLDAEGIVIPFPQREVRLVED